MKNLKTQDGWRTIGHEKAVNSLRRGMQECRLSHAYLLVGPSNVGKMTLALDLARMVNCLENEKPCGECSQCRRIEEGFHADVRIVGLEPQKTGDGRSRVAIGIDQVRDIQRDASLKPYEGRHRVFVFDGAEHLSEEAANSLLKILEEPPEQVIIVLLASDSARLLPTILSRCQKLELKLLPTPILAHELESRYDVDSQKALEIARLSGGRPGWAFQAISQPDLLDSRVEKLSEIANTFNSGMEERFSYAARLASKFSQNRESARQELELCLEWWRDVMLIEEGVPDLVTNLSNMDVQQRMADSLTSAQVAGVIRAIQEAIDHLESNVNPRLALEGMMLAMP